MPPVRKITNRQLEIIVDFAEANKSIVLNLGKGFLAQEQANKAWEDLAKKLNAIGGGIIKTAKKWKRYWHLLKCRTKAKAADCRRAHTGTGGGLDSLIPLSNLEERIVSIVSKVAEEGIVEVPSPMNLGETLVLPSSDPRDNVPLGSFNDEDGSERHEVKQEAENNTVVDIEDPLEQYLDVSDETIASDVEVIAEPTPKVNISSEQEPREMTAGHSARRPPRINRVERMPRWAHDLQERRLAFENRIVNAIEDLGATNRAILACLQQLIGHLNRSD